MAKNKSGDTAVGLKGTKYADSLTWGNNTKATINYSRGDGADTIIGLDPSEPKNKKTQDICPGSSCYVYDRKENTFP